MFRDSRHDHELCVTATIVDGVVLARSALHHSLNYRSVAVFGRARRIVDEEAKAHTFRVIVDHVVPGRWEQLRPMTASDVRQTDVWELDLAEASAKVRTGRRSTTTQTSPGRFGPACSPWDWWRPASPFPTS